MENIQVSVRIRPLSESEIKVDDGSLWGISQPHNLYIQPHMQKEILFGKRMNMGNRSQFTFDQCYSANVNNEQIYNQGIKNIVLGSLSGINGTVFVYGQTGSGKTYTMLGSESKTRIDDGILLRSLQDLFDSVNSDLDKTYMLRCSYFEIYNESIYDLLKPVSRLSDVLTINEDQKKEFFIKGLTEESISSAQEVLEVVRRGELNRHYAQTTMNHNSSRSHTIFRINVQSITNRLIRNYRREQSQLRLLTIDQLGSSRLSDVSDTRVPEGGQVQGALITESVLNFIDLAGSEKVSNHANLIDDSLQSINENKEYVIWQLFNNFMSIRENSSTQRTKDRVKEGQYINKSLFFLTQVIYMKAEDAPHVPYRNSSLTKILRSSLGGNSRTVIILCINPTVQQFELTLSTLRFGINAKKIENKVHANIHNHDDDEALKILISEYEKKIRDLEKSKNGDRAMIEILTHKLTEQSEVVRLLEERITHRNKKNFNGALPINKFKVPLECRKKIILNYNEQDQYNFEEVGEVMLTQKQLKKQKQKPIDYHDCAGKLALAGFRVQKNRSETLQQLMEQMNENYQTVRQEANNQHIRSKAAEVDLANLRDEYSHLFNSNRMLIDKSSRMASILDLNDIDKMLPNEIQELKRFYSKATIEIEKEEWRREFLKDYNGVITNEIRTNRKQLLQSSISMVDILKDENEKSLLIKALYKNKQEFEHFNSQINMIVNQYSKQSSRQVETDSQFFKEYLDQLFYEQLPQNWRVNPNVTFEELQQQIKQFLEPEGSLETSPFKKSLDSSFDSNTVVEINTTNYNIEQESQINIDKSKGMFFKGKDKHSSSIFTQSLVNFISEVDREKLLMQAWESEIDKQNSEIDNKNSSNTSAMLQQLDRNTSQQTNELTTLNTTANISTSVQALSKMRSYQTPDSRYRKPTKTTSSTSQPKKKSSNNLNNVPLKTKSSAERGSLVKQPIVTGVKDSRKTSMTGRKSLQNNIVKKNPVVQKTSIIKHQTISDENSNTSMLTLQLDQSHIYGNNIFKLEESISPEKLITNRLSKRSESMYQSQIFNELQYFNGKQ